MSKTSIERSIKTIQDSLKTSLDYTDLAYKGPENGKPFVLHQGSAVINQYKIWLQSTATDYHRQPGKGGFFDNQLNRYKFDPSSEEAIKSDLIAQSGVRFPHIEVIACEVHCIFQQRKWQVKVVVRDKITGIIGIDESGIFVDATNA